MENKRRIIPPASHKDASGAYLPSDPVPEIPSDTGSDVDLSKLLDQGREVLRREMKHLMLESSRGKLSAGSARDLVNYLKLLDELAREEDDALRNYTPEQLQAIKDARS